jgi:putative inorganic carbon (hco3(-)) transporter
MDKEFRQYLKPALIFLGLVLLSTWPFMHIIAEPHDGQRLVSSVLIAITLSVRLWFVKLSVKLHLGMVVGFLWGIGAVCLSPMPFWSSLEFAMLFSVVLLCISLFPRVNTATIRQLTVIFTMVQAFYLSQNLTYYIATMLTSDKLVPYTLATGFSNIRFYGQFLIWTVPFILGVLATYPSLAYRNVIVFVLMLDWAYQFLTGTRAFVLAMVTSAIFVWYFTRDTKHLWKQYTKWLLISAVGGFAAYSLMLFVIPNLFGVNVDIALDYSARRNMLDSSGRIHLWQESFRLMCEHPWLGAGPMMTAMLVDLKTSAHPHNFVVQLLAEWGIPFTCVFLIFITVGFARWIKLIDINRIERVPLALPVVSALSAGIAAGFVDGLIVMPVSLVYMTIVIGLLAGLWRTWTPLDTRISFPKWLIPLFAAPVIYVAVYTVNMWSSRNVVIELRQPISGNGYKMIQDDNPRFWVEGHIVLVKSESESEK